MQSLIEEIKNKKELKSLSNDFIGSIAKQVLEKEKVSLDKKANRKKIIKETRKVLREVYGAFKRTKYHKKEKLLQEITSLSDIEAHDRILELHTSTKERLPYYDSVYQQIFSITGKPQSILDLGCGLNPLSLPHMQLEEVTYYASELTQEDSDFIQRYLDKLKIKGNTFPMDLTRIDVLPQADVCFLFKLLDTLETLKRNVTKEILEKLQTRWAVVSFPLKTLGGRRTISKRRLVWFERMISSYQYKTFEIPNEIFYVIKLRQ